MTKTERVLVLAYGDCRVRYSEQSAVRLYSQWWVEEVWLRSIPRRKG